MRKPFDGAQDRPFWEEAIEKVLSHISGADFNPGGPNGRPFGITREELENTIYAEIERRLEEEPPLRLVAELLAQGRPPEVEAFVWMPPDGEPEVRVKAISAPESFMPSRADKKRRYWLIEIPATAGTAEDAEGAEEKGHNGHK